MRRPVLLIFSLLLLSAAATAAPFDDSAELRRQYDEFRGNPDHSDHAAISSPAELAELYLVYARKALVNGDAAAAIKNLTAGQELAPDDGRFSMLLGDIYSRSGDELLAEDHLQEAVRLIPGEVAPLNRLADHYYQAGKLDEALGTLRQAQKLSPDDSELNARIARIERELTVEAEMVRDVRAIFSVKYDEQIHADFAGRVVELLEDAYTEQGSLLNHYPQKTVQVILYSRNDYDMTTGAPAWSAGRFDGKIRIPIGAHPIGMRDLKRILEHEYNHFLAQQLSRGRAPAWIYEGAAMTAETSPRYGQRDKVDGLIDFRELERSFDRFDKTQARRAYLQSYSFVSYLVDQFGWHVLKDLLQAYGQGFPTTEAFASVFKDFGLDYRTLLDEWQAGF